MLQIFFAFLAGILTIAAPCTLPLLPVLLGVSIGQKDRFRPIFIVAGFVVVFTGAAILLSLLGKYSGFNANIARDIGIAILALFGFLLLFEKPFELLALKLVPLISKTSRAAGLGNRGAWSALILGMSLGLVWTPCAGPVLASILTLIALQKNLAASAILLFAYSLGVGVPMLAIAYGGQYASEKAQVISQYSRLLQKIFGVLIIALAILMFFNYDAKLYALVLEYVPALSPKF